MYLEQAVVSYKICILSAANFLPIILFLKTKCRKEAGDHRCTKMRNLLVQQDRYKILRGDKCQFI